MLFYKTYHHPPLGCNGSAWKRGVRVEEIIEHVYDNDDDDDNSNSNSNDSNSESF